MLPHEVIRNILDVLDEQTRKRICNIVCKSWSKALWLGTPFEEPLSSRIKCFNVAHKRKIKKEAHAKRIWGGKRGQLNEYQVVRMQTVATLFYGGRVNVSM